MGANPSRSEVFAVNFAALAREIAMDILPLPEILRLHQVSDEDWARIESNANFQTMLAGLVREWNSALSTRDRVKAKAASALESQIETYVQDIADLSIPLAQRVEAGKFLARLGELDGGREQGQGEKFSISINIGEKHVHTDVVKGPLIEGGVIPEVE